LDGDFIVVTPPKDLHNGEIGVVLIDDEATVKRFHRGKGKVILKPENSTMKPVIYSAGGISILGKVIGIIRKMQFVVAREFDSKNKEETPYSLQLDFLDQERVPSERTG
jgi:repressor LexA